MSDTVGLCVLLVLALSNHATRFFSVFFTQLSEFFRCQNYVISSSESVCRMFFRVRPRFFFVSRLLASACTGSAKKKQTEHERTPTARGL